MSYEPPPGPPNQPPPPPTPYPPPGQVPPAAGYPPQPWTPSGPPQKPPRRWKTWQVITSGLVGLVLGAGIGAVASGGGDGDDEAEADGAESTTVDEETTAEPSDTTTEETTPPDPGGGDEGTQDNPYPPGTAADVGDWTVTVVGFNADATAEVAAGNEFNEPAPAGTVYVALDMTAVYNGGEEPSSFGFEVQAALVLPNGTVLGAAESPFVALPDGWDSSAEVFEGGQISGKQVWAVPVDQVSGAVARVQTGIGADEAWFALR